MRTLLSIERTLLAYIRSALTLFVAGATLIQFFRHGVFQSSGYVLIPIGFVTFVFGILRYRRLRSRVLFPAGGESAGHGEDRDEADEKDD